MSMNGHLQEVSPALLERLHRDEALRYQLVTAGSVAGLGVPLHGNPAHAIDAMLAGALPQPVGCAYRLVPRFLRRWLLGRILPAELAGARLPDIEALDRGSPHDDDDHNHDVDDTIDGAGEALALHKDWHLVHAALAGTPDEAPGPAGDAVLGGEEVGDDLGYGPLRLLTPDRAAAVAAFLADQPLQQLVKRLRTGPHAQNDELYGADWLRDRETAGILQMRLTSLQAFYAGVAARGSGVAAWLA
jgi:hypothetical protein